MSFVTFAALDRGRRRGVRRGGHPGPCARFAKPRSGHPPLSLALGDRADREARELDRAQRLYARKDYSQAAAVFGRYRSLEAQVGSALAAWPSGTIARLENSPGGPPAQRARRVPPRACLLLGSRATRTPWPPGALRRGSSPTRPTRCEPATSSTRSFAPGLPSLRAVVPAVAPDPRPAAGRSSSPRCARTPREAARTRRSSTGRAAAARPAALGRAGVRRRGAARAERRRRAGRRGRRPLRQGRAGAGLRQARAADAGLSAGPDGALPPRSAAALVGAAEGGSEAVATCPAAGAATPCSASRRRSTWQPSDALGPT